MDGARDIAGISIPFTLGVAAGAFSTAPGVPSGLAAAASLSLLALTLISCRFRSLTRFRLCILYALAGLFCFYCAFQHAPAGTPAFAGRACSILKDSIDAVPFPHPASNSMVKALLTGDRSGLSRDITESFRQSGASHILALSGLHLGVIYLIISRILSVLGNSPSGRRIRCAVTILAAGFYTIMTGAGASIVRAFLFITIGELSRLSPERRTTPAGTFFTALTVQLALSPRVILTTGFQLSYLAMTGICFIFPAMSRWYPQDGRFQPLRKVWESISLTISCQLFTAPLVWYRFHSFPEYFLITNLAALPMVSAIMALSVLTTVLCAMSVCPEMVIDLNDSLIQLFLRTLGTIGRL